MNVWPYVAYAFWLHGMATKFVKHGHAHFVQYRRCSIQAIKKLIPTRLSQNRRVFKLGFSCSSEFIYMHVFPCLSGRCHAAAMPSLQMEWPTVEQNSQCVVVLCFFSVQVSWRFPTWLYQNRRASCFSCSSEFSSCLVFLAGHRCHVSCNPATPPQYCTCTLAPSWVWPTKSNLKFNKCILFSTGGLGLKHIKVCCIVDALGQYDDLCVLFCFFHVYKGLRGRQDVADSKANIHKTSHKFNCWA